MEYRMRYSEAAAYLGISERTLRRHKKAGHIPFRKLGREVFFSKKGLDDLAAQFTFQEQS